MIMANEPGDFVVPRRGDLYHLKVQDLVNYELPDVTKVVEHHADTKDSHVDVQLSVVPEKEGLSGTDLRVDMIESLLTSQEKAKASEGLVWYISQAGVTANVREGKTTLIAGLKGFGSFADNPAWAKVLAGQGVSFLYLEDPSSIFSGDGLSDKGKTIVEAANEAGLLLMAHGASDAQSKALLEHTKKPVALLVEDVPAKGTLDKVKEKDAAVGLLWTKETVGSQYFQNMEKIKDAVGTKYLMIVNEDCVRKDEGKTAMLDVFAEIVKADYERDDFANVVSVTFLRILDEARDVGPKVPTRGRPF
jgi:microsomal dipeptidase-like Zn-dependent dipeptidase